MTYSCFPGFSLLSLEPSFLPVGKGTHGIYMICVMPTPDEYVFLMKKSYDELYLRVDEEVINNQALFLLDGFIRCEWDNPDFILMLFAWERIMNL